MAEIYTVYFSVNGEVSHAYFERRNNAVVLAGILEDGDHDPTVTDMQRNVVWPVDVRAQIVTMLRKNEPMTLYELDEIVNHPRAEIQTCLRRMMSDADVMWGSDGKYRLATKLEDDG